MYQLTKGIGLLKRDIMISLNGEYVPRVVNGIDFNADLMKMIGRMTTMMMTKTTSKRDKDNPICYSKSGYTPASLLFTVLMASLWCLLYSANS
jgi:hypothetical protein